MRTSTRAEAWDVAGGSASTVVAVIDTGIDFAHPDLGGSVTASPRMWTNAGESCTGCRTDGLDNDGNGYVDDWRGWDFANRDSDPADDHGHGTHVAGTIGAVGDNGIGVAGVNRSGVRLMALKFLDAEGLRNHGRRASRPSSMRPPRERTSSTHSWGGEGYSQATVDALAEADRLGTLFVAAAGNDARDNDSQPHYPSSYDVPNVVAVAATNSSDALADFSNLGRESVDLAAPGDRIYSTLPGGAYDWWSGTSMATPHVAGAAALLRAVFPSATDLATKALLLRAVDERSSLSWIATRGRLNVDRAVRCAGAGKTWIESPRPGFTVSVGEAVQIRAIGATCASPGPLTVTANGTAVALTPRGDGLYTGSYVPGATGPLTLAAAAGADTQSSAGTVVDNYRFEDGPYSWIDATAGGTRLPLGDDASASVPLPFPFGFFGASFTSVKVSSNGYLVLGPSAATNERNVSVPNWTEPNGFIAPHWDDLNPAASGGVWYRTVGTAPARRFVVAWVDVRHFAEIAPGTITFEVVLEEGTNAIAYQYADLEIGHDFYDWGGSATVGVENADGTVGREYLYGPDDQRLRPYVGAKSLRFLYGVGGTPPPPPPPPAAALLLLPASAAAASSAASASPSARGHDAAADDDHVRPGDADHVAAGDVPLRLERVRLDLPLQARRGGVHGLHLAEDLQRALVHDPHVPRARNRCGGQCRPDAGDLDVARAADHRRAEGAAGAEGAEGQDGPRALSSSS